MPVPGTINRRAFLQGAAATLAAAAIPAQLVGAASAAAPVAVAEAPLGNVTWGWSIDGSTWSTGARSAEEALWDAMSEMCDEGSVSVARCVLDPIEYRGDRMAEGLAEWMASPTYRPARAVVHAFSQSNVDCDWEGDLHEAIHSVDSTPLDAPILAALSAALLRSADLEASLRVASLDAAAFGPATKTEIADAASRQAVLHDQALADELSEAVRRWVRGTAIPRASRTLTTYDERTVEVEYDEDNDEFREVAPGVPLAA